MNCIFRKEESCADCSLNNRPFVPPQIPSDFSKDKKIIWIVGEAPGYEEARVKVPFMGKAGSLLRAVLRETGFNGDDLFLIITNACLCHPEGNATPSIKMIQSCRKNLLKLYQLHPPEFIIALGRSALKALEIDMSIEKNRGTVADTKYGKCLITYHPSAILRSNYKLESLFYNDIRKAYSIISQKKEDNVIPSVYKLKTTKSILDAISSLKGEVALDIETTVPSGNGQWHEGGIDPYEKNGKIVSMAFASSDTVFCFPFEGEEHVKKIIKRSQSSPLLERLLEELKADIDIERIKAALKQLFQKKDVFLIAHNGKFEVKHLVTKLGLYPPIWRDTMVMAYLINEKMQGFYSLSSLVSSYLPFYDNYKAKYHEKDFLMYNSMDAFLELKLNEKMKKHVEILGPQKRYIEKAERAIMNYIYPLIIDMELNGIKINISSLEECNGLVFGLKEKIQKIINLFKEDNKKETKELPHIETLEEKKLSTDTIRDNIDLTLYKDTLSKLNIIEISYIKNLMFFTNGKGRIYPSYKITGTPDGKILSTEPKLQKIPEEKIKICEKCMIIHMEKEERCSICGKNDFIEIFDPGKTFNAEEGNVLINISFDHLETRIILHLSKEQIIKNGETDINSFAASKMFKIPYEKIEANKDRDFYSMCRRRAADAIFAVTYGLTEIDLALQKNIEKKEAKDTIWRFYEGFPKIKQWIDYISEFVKNNGFCYTPFGRIRRFYTIEPRFLREAYSFIIQSFASDLILITANRIKYLINPLKGRIVRFISSSSEKNISRFLLTIEIPEDKVEDALILAKGAITTIEQQFNLSIPFSSKLNQK